MSRSLPLLFVVLLSSITRSFSQLSGVKYIPGDYTSIANAVAAVNTLGVGSGGVTFNIAGGYTETAINITLTTTTSSQANPIVFQKWGTVDNPLPHVKMLLTSPLLCVQQDQQLNLRFKLYITGA